MDESLAGRGNQATDLGVQLKTKRKMWNKK